MSSVACQPLSFQYHSEMTNTFLYFAYGSNMLTKKLVSRAPSAQTPKTGYVEGRKLTFDKVSKDGSGKCDMEKTANLSDKVYGVIFKVAETDSGSLDTAEGCGNGYKRAEIPVVIADKRMSARTYIATNKDTNLLPYDWYKEQVIAGAIEHKLPETYIKGIRSIKPQQDANKKREAKEKALLPKSA